jgi:hypothetical protein
MRRYTGLVLVVAVVLLLAWQAYVIVCHAQAGATISETIQAMAFKYPILPYAVGILTGHWFWPVRSACPHCGKEP